MTCRLEMSIVQKVSDTCTSFVKSPTVIQGEMRGFDIASGPRDWAADMVVVKSPGLPLAGLYWRGWGLTLIGA